MNIMNRSSLSQDIDSLQKNEMSLQNFIKRNGYDYFIHLIFETNFQSLNQKTSTITDFVNCGASVYQDIDTFHTFLQIQRETPVDHFLIYDIAKKITSLFHANQNICILSAELLAKLLIDRISASADGVSTGQYTFVNGKIAKVSCSFSQIVNDYIYRKHMSHRDFVKSSGFSDTQAADLRNGSLPVTRDILFITAYALALSSNEFIHMTEILPEADRPDLSGRLDKILIRELDEITLKRKFPELSKLNASEYIAWLEAFYRLKGGTNER